jgi:Protein of unknown function (DUF4238)
VAKHHTLPAALIGAFSSEPADHLRESLVWVARRQGHAFRQKAENVSRREGHYTMRADELFGEGTPPDRIDDMWTAAEAALSNTTAAIGAAAETGLIDACDWLQAVDLLAQLFVRNPGYDKFHYDARVEAGIDGEDTRDEINGSRTLNLQRLRPAVMYARWAIFVASEGCFVTNDCSYTPVHHLDTDEIGYIFPLRRDLAVELTAGPEDKLVTAAWEGRELELPAFALTTRDVAKLNLLMATNAVDEIYGPTEAVVAAAKAGFETEVDRIGADYIVPSGRFLAEHEYDFYGLLEKFGMALPPGSVISLRLDLLPRRWRARLIPASIARVGGLIARWADLDRGPRRGSAPILDLTAHDLGNDPPPTD